MTSQSAIFKCSQSDSTVERSLKGILIKYIWKSGNSYSLCVKIKILLTRPLSQAWEVTWKIRSSTYCYLMTCQVSWNSNLLFLSFRVYKWQNQYIPSRIWGYHYDWFVFLYMWYSINSYLCCTIFRTQNQVHIHYSHSILCLSSSHTFHQDNLLNTVHKDTHTLFQDILYNLFNI